MLKDIIKISHKHNIILKNGVFNFLERDISFSDYIFYINKHKFFYGIEGAIARSKDELFLPFRKKEDKKIIE
mgnify:CR=1 FL=1